MISITVFLVVFAMRWVFKDAPHRKGWLER